MPLPARKKPDARPVPSQDPSVKPMLETLHKQLEESQQLAGTLSEKVKNQAGEITNLLGRIVDLEKSKAAMDVPKQPVKIKVDGIRRNEVTGEIIDVDIHIKP